MNKLFRYILMVAGILLLAIILWYFKNIIAYILISGVLSLIGKPIVDFLDGLHIRKFKIPRGLSSLVTLLLLWTVVVSFFIIFVPLVVKQGQQLSTIDVEVVSETLEGPIDWAEDWAHKLNIIPDDTVSIEDYIVDKFLVLLDASLVSDIFNTVTNLLGNIFLAIFALSFITFFFLKDNRLFINGIMLFVPRKHEDRVLAVLQSIIKLLTRYFIGIGFQITGIIIIVTTGLTIVGLRFENALVIGLVAGIMNVIPYLGPVFGISIGLLLGIANSMELEFYTELLPRILYMAMVFVVYQIIDNMFFQPFIFGTSVKAHPLEIFLVIIIGGSLAGVVGLILAVPAYTVIRVFAKEFFDEYKVVQKITERL